MKGGLRSNNIAKVWFKSHAAKGLPMSENEWRAVDEYIVDSLITPTERQQATLDANHAAGLPAIDVSGPQGKFLGLLVAAIGARRVLEIGTLGGYSTIWFARALPAGGEVVTIEFDPKHASVARANIAREGLSDRVDLRIGAALEVLPGVAGAPFDLSFIDADKAHNADYFDWAVKLSRPGALVVVDNVVREGTVADPQTRDDGGLGARRLFDQVSKDPRVDATAVQTVGAKGWDGFLIARVK
jgi:predicted O-methyltransferase YrrM